MYNEARGDDSDCSPVISGVTIQRNQTSGNGGGIANTVLRPTAAAKKNAVCAPDINGNTLITRNVANNGGGVHNYGYAAPTLTNMKVTNNVVSTNGGGVYALEQTRPVLTRVEITGNIAASNGGGVATASYYLTMTNVIISGNTTPGRGGGIYNPSGGTILTNARIENNTAGTGGGIYNHVSSSGIINILVMTNGVIKDNTGGGIHNEYSFTGSSTADTILHVALTNVLIAGNRQANGAGIFSNNAVPTAAGKGISVLMTNVTITGNTATTGYGGGIFIDDDKVAVKANNSIIWGNKATVAANSAYSNLYNPTAARLAISDTNTLVEGNVYYTGTSISGITNPFVDTPTYFPAAGLRNIGSTSLYPGNADALLYQVGVTPDTLVLPSTSARYKNFKTLIEGGTLDEDNSNLKEEDVKGAVFNGSGSPYTKDAPLAAGSDTASHGPRNHTTNIDVGAYEQ
jgi:hypothetical protein